MNSEFDNVEMENAGNELDAEPWAWQIEGISKHISRHRRIDWWKNVSDYLSSLQRIRFHSSIVLVVLIVPFLRMPVHKIQDKTHNIKFIVQLESAEHLNRTENRMNSIVQC